MVRGQLFDLLSPFADLIYAIFFISFFIGTALLLFIDRQIARRAWIAAFLSVLIVVTVLGVPMFPVVDMHKFASPNLEEDRTIHELHIVDEEGNEIRYDTRAAPPVKGTRTSGLAGDMVYEYTDQERLDMATFLVDRAEKHRLDIQNGGAFIFEWFQPPRYVDSQKWSHNTITGMSEFESIRVYERDMVYSENNTELQTVSKELKLEINVRDRTISQRAE